MEKNKITIIEEKDVDIDLSKMPQPAAQDLRERAEKSWYKNRPHRHPIDIMLQFASEVSAEKDKRIA